MNSSLQIQEREIEIVNSISLLRHDKQPISMTAVDELVELFNDAAVEVMEKLDDVYFICGNTKLSSPRREIKQERPCC